MNPDLGYKKKNTLIAYAIKVSTLCVGTEGWVVSSMRRVKDQLDVRLT